jgi:para-nitrobenzyl esterase
MVAKLWPPLRCSHRFRPPGQSPAITHQWKSRRREATAFARAAIQNLQNPKFTPQDPGSSEDCLYLNVWAPTAPGPHPVYVWVHGGANVAGTTASGIGPAGPKGEHWAALRS